MKVKDIKKLNNLIVIILMVLMFMLGINIGSTLTKQKIMYIEKETVRIMDLDYIMQEV